MKLAGYFLTKIPAVPNWPEILAITGHPRFDPFHFINLLHLNPVVIGVAMFEPGDKSPNLKTSKISLLKICLTKI